MLLGSARDLFRVEYRRQGGFVGAQAEFLAMHKRNEFTGRYYHVEPDVEVLADGRYRLKAHSTSGVLQVATLVFDVQSGQSEIEWHDADPAS